jgi:hypothetical protein
MAPLCPVNAAQNSTRTRKVDIEGSGVVFEGRVVFCGKDGIQAFLQIVDLLGHDNDKCSGGAELGRERFDRSPRIINRVA